MPHLTRSGLGEVAITTTLLSIYLSARGTDRALGAVQAAVGGLERGRGRPGRGGRLGALDLAPRGGHHRERLMPPIVNASAVITCCHAGPVVIIPKQTKVMIGGSPAICAGDIAGNPTTCPVPPSPASKPCTTSTVLPVPGASISTKVMVMGKPVMLGNPSVPGITDGAPVPCPTLMVTFPGQVQVIATM